MDLHIFLMPWIVIRSFSVTENKNNVMLGRPIIAYVKIGIILPDREIAWTKKRGLKWLMKRRVAL